MKTQLKPDLPRGADNDPETTDSRVCDGRPAALLLALGIVLAGCATPGQQVATLPSPDELQPAVPASSDRAALLKLGVQALEARALLEENHVERAINAAQQVLNQQPDNLTATQVMADVAEKLGDWRVALRWWRRLSELPDLPEQQKMAVDRRIGEITGAHGDSISISASHERDEFDVSLTSMSLRSEQVAHKLVWVSDLQLRNYRFGGDTDLRRTERQSIRLAAGFRQDISRWWSWQNQLVLAQTSIGLNTSVTRNLRRAYAGLGLQYNVANYSYGNAIRDEAAIDALSAHTGLTLSNTYETSLSLSGQFRRHHILDRDHTVADSILAGANFSSLLPIGSRSLKIDYSWQYENFDPAEDAPEHGLSVDDSRRHELYLAYQWGDTDDNDTRFSIGSGLSVEDDDQYRNLYAEVSLPGIAQGTLTTRLSYSDRSEANAVNDSRLTLTLNYQARSPGNFR